jgi:CspA family cold shock protein
MRNVSVQTGTVIRFNKIKGYGFITPDNGGNEIFVHFSQIQSEGYKELTEGQRVSYELEKGERGEFASKVTIL